MSPNMSKIVLFLLFQTVIIVLFYMMYSLHTSANDRALETNTVDTTPSNNIVSKTTNTPAPTTTSAVTTTTATAAKPDNLISWKCPADPKYAEVFEPDMYKMVVEDHSDKDKWIQVAYSGHYPEPEKFVAFWKYSIHSLLWERTSPVRVHIFGNAEMRPQDIAASVNRCNYLNFEVVGHVYDNKDVNAHYVKLLFPSILGKWNGGVVKKVIHVDLDTVFYKDLMEMWNTFDEFDDKQAVGIVPEFNRMYAKEDNGRYHQNQQCVLGLPDRGQHGFNSGVLMMRIDRVNAITDPEKALSTLKSQLESKGCALSMADQDVFNVFLYRSPELFKPVSFGYNMQYVCVGYLDVDCLNYTIPTDQVVIGHWNGGVKGSPFLRQVRNVYENLDTAQLDLQYMTSELKRFMRWKTTEQLTTHRYIKFNPEWPPKNATRDASGKKRYHIIINKYKYDISWLNNSLISDIPATIYDAGTIDFGRVKAPRDNTKIYAVPNPGNSQECPSYLRFIIENYDNLPDVTFFLHDSPFNHSPNILQFIRNVIEKCPRMKWIHLNPQVLKLDTSDGTRPLIAKYPFVQEAIPIAGEKGWCVYCCAQFAVSKETILRHPKEFYYSLLLLTIDLKDCSYLEHRWHVIWGDPPCMDHYYDYKDYNTRPLDAPFPFDHPVCKGE
ncbi:hypothetical protein AKO1_007339 [Acrasis kona]|uniref:Glycosyltransferase n=1 Tax=Acrasis kona TaxID=1008807 RepID=A0AAW2YS65_9EUKA